MQNTSELARFLRYRLSQLSAENAHHRFEELARQFARLRICERILPATGPVSAGGDQGLDFESYRSYIQTSPLVGSSFLGRARDQKLGFAVSLEKKIVPKIQRDVKAICSGPISFASVHYFCETDIPVGKRHRQQEWAREQFGVELEIFDGQAISELLTDPDIFWIAIEYLGVPADMHPMEDVDDRYATNRSTWLVKDRNVANYADFARLKQGIRQATFEKNLRPDLPGWIKKMDEFSSDSFPLALRRKATYEICVAALRGQNNLTAHLDRLRWYLTNVEVADDVADIEDIANLLTYSSTAQREGHLDVSQEELRGWVDNAIAFTMERLETLTWREAQARLYQIRGQLSIAANVIDGDPTKSDHYDWWTKMLAQVEKAPLFPLERFADLLTVLAQYDSENHRYKEISERTDELLVKRTGGFVAAEKCRDRAVVMFEAQNYTGAIAQLHRAKFKWFAAETLRGSLKCMELLGECYRRLGLVYAAKYYWGSAAIVASQHDPVKYARSLVRCLASLANVCYYSGEWLDFLNAAGHAVRAELAYVNQDERLDEVSTVYQHLAYLRAITHLFSSQYDATIEPLIATAVGGSDRYEWVLPPGEADRKAIAAEDPDRIWSAVQEQFLGRPFIDTGETRAISWNALGIGWAIEFRNDFNHACCAETLSSILQVAIADLASVELLLLPLKVKVVIELTGSTKHTLERLPDNELATWKLLVPLKCFEDRDGEGILRTATLDALLSILSECSVLPSDKLNEVIDRFLEDDFTGKAFFIGVYAGIFRNQWNQAGFDSPERKLMNPLGLGRPFTTPSNAYLPWNDSDGPGYSPERANGFLRNRYGTPKRSMKVSIPRLLGDSGVREVVLRLRSEGLRDWELLIIIASIVVDERVKVKLPPEADPRSYGDLWKDMMFDEEPADEIAVDPSIFTYDRCLMQHKFNQMGVANTWGLEVRQLTPAFDAIKRLLDVRYHQRTDDIEHDAILDR